MPLSALPAHDGLKKALRRISSRIGQMEGAPLSGRGALARLRPALAALPALAGATATGRDLLRLEDVISLPLARTSPETEARDAALREGQFYARQDRWDELQNRLQDLDATCATTADGRPLADLLAAGARADVVNAVDHALTEGVALSDRSLLDGIMALERLRLEQGRTPELTALTALAHLDIATACLRQAARRPRRSGALTARAEAHRARAESLLDTGPATEPSPAWMATAEARLLALTPGAGMAQLADAHHALTTYAPRDPRPLRALGRHLAARGPEGLAALDLEARRAAARQGSPWGAGGYVWVYFDALLVSAPARANLDPAFFLDGLRDLLSPLPGQEQVNLLAAQCCLLAGISPTECAPAQDLHSPLAEAARWLVTGHLRQLHPQIWAEVAAELEMPPTHKSRGTTGQTRASGQKIALRAIAEIFRSEIAGGQRLVFTAKGMEILPT